jgi:hypothetical protein
MRINWLYRSVFAITIVALAISLTGCTKLERWDEKIGIGFEKIKSFELKDFYDLAGKDSPLFVDVPFLSTTTLTDMAKDLTGEQKERVEEWLKEQNFNRYGDPDGTMYTGGTPLFDETSGESMERFEYLLLKHPEIIKDLNINTNDVN